MKVEATLHEETTQVEVRSKSGQAKAGVFEVVLGSGAEAKSYSVQVLSRTGSRWTLQIGNRIEDVLIHRQDGRSWIDWRDRLFPIRLSDPREKYLAGAAAAGGSGSGTLTSQMPGKVVKILKKDGDEVEAGEGLVVIEAMKMQNELKAPRSGVVKVCNAEEGQIVERGQLLFEIE